MLFSQKNVSVDNCNKVTINEVEVDFVDAFTYLGITLDIQLKFLQHYNSVLSRFKQKSTYFVG